MFLKWKLIYYYNLDIVNGDKMDDSDLVSRLGRDNPRVIVDFFTDCMEKGQVGEALELWQEYDLTISRGLVAPQRYDKKVISKYVELIKDIDLEVGRDFDRAVTADYLIHNKNDFLDILMMLGEE